MTHREGRVSHLASVRMDGGVKHLERKSGRCLPTQTFIKSVMSSVRSNDIVSANIPVPNSAAARFGFDFFPSQAKITKLMRVSIAKFLNELHSELIYIVYDFNQNNHKRQKSELRFKGIR